jgi:hypothetical protein
MNRVGRMKIDEEIRIVKWVVVVAVLLLTYGLQFAALSEKTESSTVEFLKESFWSPGGQTRFLMIFVPIGLVFWFVDYVRAWKTHSFLWHVGTLVKVALYVAIIFLVFAWFIGPLTSVTTQTGLGDYVLDTVISTDGIPRIVTLIIMAAATLIVTRLQSQETPRTPREEY